MADWQDYFSKTRPPSNLDEAKRTIQDFASKHRQLGRNIVLVTSGGTTVPIESNTVRFVDNFSQGTRGACSAEYFLMHGYAVIFLHRQRSYEPFCRHFEGHNALDLLELQLDTSGACRVTVDETRAPGLQDVVRRYKEVQNGCLLLKIGFMTLSDYLFLLKASAEALSPLGNHVMFYLAAAVSDFYIPDNELAEHKIQSSDSSFQLNMTPTPKMLSPLVKEWAKNAFVVSFKLETDVNIISRKAREALQRYNHQVVIANILQTRRKTVVLVTPTDESAIWMSDQDLEMGKEIEEKIVNELTRRHVALTNGPIETASQMSPVVQSNVSFSPQTQFSNQTSLIQNTLPNTAVSNNMPGLAPINVYQNNAVGVKTATIPNVLLQLKDGEYTTNSELLPTTLLKRSVSAKEDRCMLTPEMQEFIREFKRRRINLGYTQDDVGRELSALNGPTYSQSFISRFEGKQLGMKAAERMRPVLEGWIQTKEEEHGGRNKYSKKRRKRTSFPQDVLDILNDCFQKNSKPTLDEMQDIANKINRDLITVKVWFCNKKQSLRRSGHAVPGTFRSNSMKELGSKRTRKSEADITDVFPITQNAIKTLVPVSTSTGGAVTMPFFIQDGNTLQLVSGTPTNATQTNTQGGNTLATTLQQQQIVHLSQLPLLTSMAVMNNGLNATNPQTGGATAHVISNGRVLPNGTVIQISNNSLSQSHLTQNINNNNSNSISDGSVIIGSGDNDSSLNTSGQESANGDIQLLAANEASLSSHIIAPHIRGETESEETESSAICLDNDGNKSNTMKQQENLLSRGVIERNVISISSK